MTACNSFDWNGVTYTESGTYTFTTTNAAGCDSTATLDLSIIFVQEVTSVEIDNITATTASLDWDNASPTNIYNIQYSINGGSTWIEIINHVGSFINFNDLNPSTTYNIQITSSAYGCESEIFNTSFTTEANCIIPENISLTATPFEVTLSWDALDGADSYNVVYNLPGTGWQTVTVTDNFFTLSHNGNGLAYFYVRSVCSDTYLSPYSSLQYIELPSCPSISLDASTTAFCLVSLLL